jgi:hypothetical protein
MTNLTASQLRQALSLREKIDGLESELTQLLGGVSTRSTRPVAAASQDNGQSAGKKRRRPMSAAVKARIAASARKRWKLAKAAGKNSLGA